MTELEIAHRGGQPGNQNARKPANRWQKALERALARAADSETEQGLNQVADKVVAGALEGDKDCWKEIAERFDGKVPQGLMHSGPDGGDLPIAVSVVLTPAALPKPEE
jgi:hypothetical protein